jgi:probable HAF family extracellular repeat protein
MRRSWVVGLLISFPFATPVAAAGSVPRQAEALVPQPTWAADSPTTEAVPPTYDLVDLGTLGGATSWAKDVDAAGRVVGQAETGGNGAGCGGGEATADHAFLWADGRMTDLGTLGGTNSAAAEIAATGLIVGWAETAAGAQHAALWDHGIATDLGTLGGTNSAATAVNAEGQVVGWAETGRPDENQWSGVERHAFLWEAGKLTDLAPLVAAAAIDDAGRVVGQVEDGGAALMEDGHLIDLAPLVEVAGIDAAGRIVGAVEVAEGHQHAAIWDDGVVTDLGALQDRHQDSAAADINATGQIVGTAWFATLCGWPTVGVLWDHGKPAELADLLADDGPLILAPPQPVYLIDAAAINDAGQIAATILVDYTPHAVLLTPRA